jgi:hypothetical protein
MRAENNRKSSAYLLHSVQHDQLIIDIIHDYKYKYKLLYYKYGTKIKVLLKSEITIYKIKCQCAQLLDVLIAKKRIV